MFLTVPSEQGFAHSPLTGQDPPAPPVPTPFPFHPPQPLQSQPQQPQIHFASHHASHYPSHQQHRREHCQQPPNLSNGSSFPRSEFHQPVGPPMPFPPDPRQPPIVDMPLNSRVVMPHQHAFPSTLPDPACGSAPTFMPGPAHTASFADQARGNPDHVEMANQCHDRMVAAAQPLTNAIQAPGRFGVDAVEGPGFSDPAPSPTEDESNSANASGSGWSPDEAILHNAVPCNHVSDWRRLRVHKGIVQFLCARCHHKWRISWRLSRQWARLLSNQNSNNGIASIDGAGVDENEAPDE